MNRKRLPYPIVRDARGRVFPVIPENPGPLTPYKDIEAIRRYEKKGKKALKSGGLTKGYLEYWYRLEAKRQEKIAKKRKAVKHG